MYLEGYVDEGLVETVSTDNDPTLVHQEVHRSGGTTVTQREYHQTFDMTPGELGAFGLTEQTLG